MSGRSGYINCEATQPHLCTRESRGILIIEGRKLINTKMSLNKQTLLKSRSGMGTVAHTCNSSTLGG